MYEIGLPFLHCGSLVYKRLIDTHMYMHHKLCNKAEIIKGILNHKQSTMFLSDFGSLHVL